MAVVSGSQPWWPVDKLIVGYLAASGLLILFSSGRIPQAAWLLALRIAGILVLILAIRKPNPRSWVFRHWYPLPYVAACYKEMSILIPAIRGTDVDAELARLDFTFWGAHPTVWLERMQTPWLTEFLQIVYALFVPAVLLVAALLWWKRRFAEFRYYAFLIALGFLVSYVGYFLAPARGPRFLLHDLQHAELRGLWLFNLLQTALDRLEAAHYDCFPSGHTELTVLAWWGSRQVSAILSGTFFVYTLCIIFATVYLRYHYTVDLLAGAVVAVLLLVASPHLYRAMERGR
jgi:membrane-associated phospholipid phosphatase